MIDDSVTDYPILLGAICHLRFHLKWILPIPRHLGTRITSV